MTKSDFIEHIRNVPNIYSFIVELFIYIESTSEQKIHKKYHIALENNTFFLDVIAQLIEELFIINLHEFGEWLENWIHEFCHSDVDEMIFCYESLLRIDNVIYELNIDKRTILRRGPLNNREDYLFYFKTSDSFFSEKLSRKGIRNRRQTIEFDTNSINWDFYNFEIIKNTKLYDYQPVVKQYRHNFVFKDELKIGFLPLSLKKWFSIIPNNKTKNFSIVYDNSTIKKHNNLLKDLLMECEKLQVDIAIFPELSMNSESEDEIRRFILNSNFQYTKLCFLGSIWNNNVNEAVLITSQGTTLIREQKKVSYRYFNKKEKCYYNEEIYGDNNIQFVDIDGLGRIAYLICADFNDDALNAICSIMHTNFIFVSAFSNDTDNMLKTARGFAERKAISTVLCNSCAAIIDFNNSTFYDSFAVIPEAKDKHLFANEICKNSLCNNKLKCELCVKTVTLHRN